MERALDFGRQEREPQMPAVPKNRQNAILTHWPSFSKFVKSASDGCHLCMLFVLRVAPNYRLPIQGWEKEAIPEQFSGRSTIKIMSSLADRIGFHSIRLEYPMPEDVISRRGERSTMDLLMRKSTGQPPRRIFRCLLTPRRL